VPFGDDSNIHGRIETKGLVDMLHRTSIIAGSPSQFPRFVQAARSLAERQGATAVQAPMVDSVTEAASMTRQRFTSPEWLITIGGIVFVFTLAVSAVFVREIRWLHLAQASLYLTAILLSIRLNRWGYFIGASAAGLWNALAMFASPLFAELIENPARPDLILQVVAWLANLVVVVGSVLGYGRLPIKSRRDIGGLVVAFLGTTALLVAPTAILAPDYLVAFTRARHPHWHGFARDVPGIVFGALATRD